MLYADVHTHLDFPDYSNDLKEVIQRASEKGVKRIIANGVNPSSNKKVLELAKNYDVVKPALGFYPTDSLEYSEKEIDEEFEKIRKNKDLVGFGEVGLDYKYLPERNFEEAKKKQKILFQRFIELSEKTRKPLIIHSRKAELDILEMLESSSLKNPVLHCFMAKKKLVQRASDNGYYLSVLPIINKLQQIRDLVSLVSLKQLLTETDSPYMSPFGGRNEPSNVLLCVKEIASIKKLEEEEVANNLYMNYRKVFND